MNSYLYRMNLLSPKHAVQHDDIDATRHAQSVMDPARSSDHKGRELCIIANRHPLRTPRSEHRCILSAHARESFRAIANGGLYRFVSFVMFFIKNMDWIFLRSLRIRVNPTQVRVLVLLQFNSLQNSWSFV
jgi:hypothetical protein